MPERKNPSLSEILETFRKSMAKTAGEEEMAEMAMADPGMAGLEPPHPEDCECPECAPEASVEDLAQAAQTLDEARAGADMAEEQVVDAADALKAIADDFIEERAETISKEAQLFGQLFAASCMEEMNKTAQLQEREARAYQLVANAITENGMRKTAAQQMNAVYDEAWRATMAKLAGMDSPEELEDAVGHELNPEEIQAIVEAVQEQAGEEADASELASLIAEEAGDEDLSDEEIQELAAQLAEAEDDEDDEVDPEAMAAAANLMAEAREGDLDDELDKAASLAYDSATLAIHGDRLEKTAAEAYALTAQALGY